LCWRVKNSHRVGGARRSAATDDARTGLGHDSRTVSTVLQDAQRDGPAASPMAPLPLDIDQPLRRAVGSLASAAQPQPAARQPAASPDNGSVIH